MRSLTAALAFAGGTYRLDGVARMRERPIGDLVDALNALGASVRYAGDAGYPPLVIEPARLAGSTPLTYAARCRASSSAPADGGAVDSAAGALASTFRAR